MLISSLSSLAGDDPELALPSQAKEMADQLGEWEAQQRRALELKIEEKRKQVAKSMETFLESETKSGNLDGAIAIGAFIDTLQKSNETPTAETVENSPHKLDGNLLDNTKWTSPYEGTGLQVLEFDRRGELTINGKRSDVDYEISKGNDGETILQIYFYDDPTVAVIQVKDDEPSAILHGNKKVMFERAK